VLAGIVAASSTLPATAAPLGWRGDRAAIQVLAGPDDPDELARFTDVFIAAHVRELHVPGAAVEVVSAGRVLLEKGYGVADLDRRTPFGPDTRLRAKSVSKTFTATAVMQLAQAGTLDLTANVASYLHGFRLPGGNDPPITISQLLTQTSGIGDRGIGTMTADRTAAADLRGYLESHIPPRLNPPGTVFLYTDHGISLAGLAVQEASGLPFAQYMRERLLEPLGMDKSAFDPPLEDQPDLATGYQFTRGTFQKAPVGYFHVAPAVALVTTGHDMGRYMGAMLEGGTIAGRRVLSPEAVTVQEAVHFSMQPNTPGVAFGLYEWPRNGERVLLHGGLGHGYSTLLVLIPDRHVGLFVGANSDEPALRWSYLRAFMDRYYPSRVISLPAAPADADLTRFAGTYREYRYDGGQHELLKQVIDQGTIEVSADRTHSLSWEPGRWVEIAPLVFQNLDDQNERLSFQTDANGRIARVLIPPDEARMSVSTFQTLQAFAAGFLLFAVLFTSAVISWLVFARRDQARALAGVVGLLNLVFLVAAPLLFLAYAGLNGTEIDFGESLRFTVVFAIPFVTAALAVPLAVVAVRSWQARRWRPAARIQVSATALAAVLFPFFLANWRLFGVGG